MRTSPPRIGRGVVSLALSLREARRYQLIRKRLCRIIREVFGLRCDRTSSDDQQRSFAEVYIALQMNLLNKRRVGAFRALVLLSPQTRLDETG
jgi:hypothetical protein